MTPELHEAYLKLVAAQLDAVNARLDWLCRGVNVLVPLAIVAVCTLLYLAVRK